MGEKKAFTAVALAAPIVWGLIAGYQFPDATLMGDYRVKSGMRFENGRYVLSQRVTSDALRDVFYNLKEF